jgi:tetratricopeptide (TPR) repeat protein
VTLDGAIVDEAGGLGELLSRHADEVMRSVAPDEQRQRIVESVFRALTAVNADGNAIRNPLPFQRLCAITDAAPNELRLILDAFRAPGVSFITPYPPKSIESNTTVDIAHEALIRCWRRIIDKENGWLHKEVSDGLAWRTLLYQAEGFDSDKSSFLSALATEARVAWIRGRNEAWAERYGGGWPHVAALIEASRDHWENERRKREAEQREDLVKAQTMQRAFVMRPFGKKKAKAKKDDIAERVIDFDQIDRELIAPALKAVGLGAAATGEFIAEGNIRDDLFSLILEADLVICDVTIDNANVFYELGIRHALRKKRTVLIKGGPVADEVPFDNLTDRYLAYQIDDPKRSLPDLINTLTATRASDRTDSPVFKLLPTLPEVDPDSVMVLPKDLAEEIDRAKAAKVFGWLRLLSQEVETRRFQWLALRAIGRAQWDIGDIDGACATYKKLIDRDPDDVEGNNALANLYERQNRKERRPELLTASDLAVKKVLSSNRSTRDQKTEALSLMGRNAKTRWRQTFESVPELAQRRKAAVNRQLFLACEAYLKAYSANVSHYWSGLAALQMCAIAASLSTEDTWEDCFDNTQAALDKKDELTRASEDLKGAVKLAMRQAQENEPAGSNDRAWADIGYAEWLFLTEPKDTRVRRAYTDSVPSSPWFLDAVKNQLELFAKLGFKPDLANAIIEDLTAAADPQTADPRPGSIVILAGHRIDEPSRHPPRFPESAESVVRASLQEKLTRLNKDNGGVRILASAAPGTDIICHELCRDLDIKSTICLPMPIETFSQVAFKSLESWRSRFLALVGGKSLCLQLSDSAELPGWLQSTGINFWERGNRWVLQLALSTPASKVSLIAVLDETQPADGLGGTAHMVQIARAASRVDIEVIKLKDGAVSPL